MRTPGPKRRFEAYPEAPETFFWTVVAAQITFVADAAGAVRHAVLHQSGRDIPLPRMHDGDPAEGFQA
jgi:hypothetical protein